MKRKKKENDFLFFFKFRKSKLLSYTYIVNLRNKIRI